MYIKILLDFDNFRNVGIKVFKEAWFKTQVSRLQLILIIPENDFNIVFGVERKKILQLRPNRWKAELNDLFCTHMLY